jgi:acetyl esterase/lipase
MKKLFALLSFQIIFWGVSAQLTPCDSANFDCSLDLRQQMFFNIVTSDPISYAKNPLPASFRDVKYLNDAYSAANGPCPPPTADQCLNDASSLVYTVTYPKDHDYDACPLKAIVLFHAGGFAECSNYQLYLITTLATNLAQKGFVVYDAEYRRGVVQDAIDPSYTTAQQYLGPYRAEQDERGFFRSMIKKERNKSSFPDEVWRIDTSNIFIGGMSAGAFSALNVAWYTNAMTYSLFAPPITSGSINSVLGTPDAEDFYYGEPDNDFYSFYQPKIKAVCSLWGAIPMPYNPYGNINQQPAFFAAARLTPAIMFHGYLDKTFPFINGSPFSQNVNLSPANPPEELIYNSINYCITNGPFSVNPFSNVVDVINGSSYNIYKILTYYSIKCELYIDCSMGHGLDDNCCLSPPDKKKNKTTQQCTVSCNYGSNFGTSASNQEETAEYMSERIAVFFQKILHQSQSSFTHNVFIDCENTSHNCGPNTNCDIHACNGQTIDF